MDPRDARVTAAEVEAIRRTLRCRVVAVPYPLMAFGCVDLGGVPVTAAVGRDHIAPYAATAFALGIALSARSLRRRAATEGLQLSVTPWLVTAVALFVASATTSRAGFALDVETISTVGPFLVQATGLWLFGRWARSDVLAAVTLLMLVASGVIGALASGNIAVALQFAVYGALLVAAGRWVATHAAI